MSASKPLGATGADDCSPSSFPPLAAYWRYWRRNSTPFAVDRSGSMSRWVKEETTVMRLRARVTATFRRRSPPFCRMGPKL
jgi:hypothetical protein